MSMSWRFSAPARSARAIAHRLAERARVREIVLIDESAAVAAGKALDIRQSGPIDGYDTRAVGHRRRPRRGRRRRRSSSPIAPTAASGRASAGSRSSAASCAPERAAPFVFAGPKQIWLMEAAARELKRAGRSADRHGGVGLADAVARARRRRARPHRRRTSTSPAGRRRSSSAGRRRRSAARS